MGGSRSSLNNERVTSIADAVLFCATRSIERTTLSPTHLTTVNLAAVNSRHAASILAILTENAGTETESILIL